MMFKKFIKLLIILFVFFISVLVTTDTYAQNERVSDGYVKFYHENGNISSEGVMKEGKPDAYWKTYYENGKIKSEGNRKNFQLDSLWIFYDEEGNTVLEINYTNGKKNGTRTTYLKDGHIAESFIDDVKQGTTKYFYADGRLKKTINFIDGLEQGFA